MREASSEKDLKRLLGNVSLQLDAIKRGYHAFSEAQLELVKKYPDMIRDELSKYQDSVYRFFSVQTSPPGEATTAVAAIASSDSTSFRSILQEVLNSERGTKFYVKIGAPTNNTASVDTSQEVVCDADEIAQNMLGLDSNEFVSRSKQDLLERVDQETYLKNSFIDFEFFKELKNMYEAFCFKIECDKKFGKKF